MLRTVVAARYVEPIRASSSLPIVVIGEDGATWVVKLRAAGQGVRALVAEVLVGELARALGLAVPELVVMALPAAIAEAEVHQELREVIAASAGDNLGVAYLHGARLIDRASAAATVAEIDPQTASRIVWLDSFAMNVDRTERNPNLMSWHGRLWLFDHGAALPFQYGGDARVAALDPFEHRRRHLLAARATELGAAHAWARSVLTVRTLGAVVAAVPAAWLTGGPSREDYFRFFRDRLAAGTFTSVADRR